MSLPKVLASTGEHFDNAFYTTAMNTTPPGIHSGSGCRMEVLQRHYKPLVDHTPFVPNEWSLVLKNLPRDKAEAIVLILNSPED